MILKRLTLNNRIRILRLVLNTGLYNKHPKLKVKFLYTYKTTIDAWSQTGGVL